MLSNDTLNLALNIYKGLTSGTFEGWRELVQDGKNEFFIDGMLYSGKALLVENSRGSFTDASNLAGALGIACVNLSIGYQHEHTHNEFIDFTATLNTLKTLSTRRIIEYLNSKEFLAECDTMGVYDYYYGDDYYRDEYGCDEYGYDDARGVMYYDYK